MKYILTIFTLLFFTTSIQSKEIVIEMLNKRDDGERMVYSEDLAKIDVGDTIKWVPTDGNHNVDWVGGPDGVTLPDRSKMSKEVSITFDNPGIYVYICTPHSIMGMIGVVVVGGDTSNKDAMAKIKIGGKGTRKLKALLDTL